MPITVAETSPNGEEEVINIAGENDGNEEEPKKQPKKISIIVWILLAVFVLVLLLWFAWAIYAGSKEDAATRRSRVIR